MAFSQTLLVMDEYMMGDLRFSLKIRSMSAKIEKTRHKARAKLREDRTASPSLRASYPACVLLEAAALGHAQTMKALHMDATRLVLSVVVALAVCAGFFAPMAEAQNVPHVYSITPSRGPTSGGTTITVVGVNFDKQG